MVKFVPVPMDRRGVSALVTNVQRGVRSHTRGGGTPAVPPLLTWPNYVRAW